MLAETITNRDNALAGKTEPVADMSAEELEVRRQWRMCRKKYYKWKDKMEKMETRKIGTQCDMEPVEEEPEPEPAPKFDLAKPKKKPKPKKPKPIQEYAPAPAPVWEPAPEPEPVVKKHVQKRVPIPKSKVSVAPR